MSGARGPRPLPANVHLLRGNPSKKPLADLIDQLQPEVEIPGCPSHLLPEARKEWRRITPELERYGLVSKLDRSSLALYCQAYARWAWAERQLQRAQALAAEKAAAAEAKGEVYTGGDGYTVPTPGGHMTYSPHWVIANKAMEQINRFLAEFGLSPASRGRVNPSNLRQSSLFDDDDHAAGGFGSI
jgi:P27 family predicted phage terminase small subunit